MRSREEIRVTAPAKLNLFLEVLARRDDGFHEIETVMVAVSVYDTVCFRATAGAAIQLTCELSAGQAALRCHRQVAANAMQDRSGDNDATDAPLISEDRTNLVYRAAELLRDRAGLDSGATIRLIKRIPAAAGLGGASSDAAATFLAGNMAWGLDWPADRLARLAAELGSDIPFFLGAPVAVCRGRGERIERISALGTWHVVIVRPPEGLCTARVYRYCRPALEPVNAGAMIRALKQGDVREIARNLTNRLQPVAARLTPWIDRLRTVFDRLDCLGHQMSGSGTSYFGLCRHARHARRVAACVRAESLGDVRVATTLSAPTCLSMTTRES